MKYRELIPKFITTSEGVDQARIELLNGCVVQITRTTTKGEKSPYTHKCRLYSPRGVEIDALGDADKYDVEVFIEEADNRGDEIVRKMDNRDWLHDLDDADLSYLDDY